MPVVEIIVAKKHKVLINSEDLHLANNGIGWGYNCGRVNVWFSRKKCRLLHRLIMKAKPGQIIDHKNGNGLDNRRENLRFCTHSQNCYNRRPEKLGNKKIHAHGFKGIIKNTKKNLKKPWIALLSCERKQHYSKYFETPEEAARAYDELAKKYHGEFARLNFP